MPTAASQVRPRGSTLIAGEEYGDHWPGWRSPGCQRSPPGSGVAHHQAAAVADAGEPEPSVGGVGEGGVEVTDQVRRSTAWKPVQRLPWSSSAG